MRTGARVALRTRRGLIRDSCGGTLDGGTLGGGALDGDTLGGGALTGGALGGTVISVSTLRMNC